MTEVLANLHEQKLKAYRLKQLTERQDKSQEEVNELNELIAETAFGEEMKNDPEYVDMIKDFISAYFHSEDVDFAIGTLYGISAQGILKKDIDDEKKKKMLKMSANMWFTFRSEAIKQLSEKMEKLKNSSLEQPKPHE